VSPAKADFLYCFGGMDAEALPKSRAPFARAIAIAPEDSESRVYSASLDAIEDTRTCFEEELAVSSETLEHGLLKVELDKLNTSIGKCRKAVTEDTKPLRVLRGYLIFTTKTSPSTRSPKPTCGKSGEFVIPTTVIAPVPSSATP